MQMLKMVNVVCEGNGMRISKEKMKIMITGGKD